MMTALESWMGSYLLNSLWQVPLLFAFGLLAVRALRHVGAEAEHRVWIGVLVLQSLLPTCSTAQFAWLRTLLVFDRARAPGNAQVTVLMSGGVTSGAFRFSAAALFAIALVYGATILYFAARFIWRWSQLNSIRNESVAVFLAGETARSWIQCSQRFGIANASLATSSRVFAPVTMGITRKLLLLPASLAPRMSKSEMQSVIAHEFAHMRRNDFLKNLAYELLSLPVSYHPALWFTRARITESREVICDRMAAGLAGRSQYSRSLLRLASLVVESAPARAVHAVGIFDSNTLERRLMKLAENQSEIRGLRRLAAIAGCLALGAATCASALALRMQVNSTDAGGHHPSAHPAYVNVSPKVMEGNLLSKVMPKYPVEAKKSGIQGKVVLSAVVDKQGNVENLNVVSGPEKLQQSSLDAVRQWKYKPYLLNGEPVEVRTTINIIYSLAKKK
jgi:TonB family protein